MAADAIGAGRHRPLRRSLPSSPASLALLLAFVAVAAYLIAQATRVSSHIWLVDELLYTKVAQSFANGTLFAAEIWGGPAGAPNALYPRLLAPLYALLPSTDAFVAGHVLNAFLFASVVFPVYLLARRLLVRWQLAVLAGVLSALVPWAVMTTVLMTESLAYPAFVWAVLAISVAVASPGVRNDLLALVAIAVAVYSRTQLILLLPVFLIAILFQALRSDSLEGGEGPSLRERLRPHVPLAGVVIGGLLLYWLLTAIGWSPLGSYRQTLSSLAFPEGLWSNSARHVAYLFVGVGIVPAIAWFAWLARTAARPATSFAQAHAFVAGLAFVGLAYEAGSFSQNLGGGQLQERYLCYLAPLLIVGMVALLSDERRPAPRVSVLAGGIATALVIGAAAFAPGETSGSILRELAAPAARTNPFIAARVEEITGLLPGGPMRTVDALALLAVLVSAALLALLALRRRLLVAIGLSAALGAFLVAETTYVMGKVIPQINGYFRERLPGVSESPRDWVDRSAPDGAEVGVLEGHLGSPDESGHWLWIEFWNERITRSFTSPDRDFKFTNFRSPRLRLNPATGLVEGSVTPYLVVSARDPLLRLRGRPLAMTTYGAQLLRLERPHRAVYNSRGVADDGYTEGRKPMLITFYDPAPAVELLLEAPAQAQRPVRYEIGGGRGPVAGTLAAGRQTPVRVPLARNRRAVLSVKAGSSIRLPGRRTVGLRVSVP